MQNIETDMVFFYNIFVLSLLVFLKSDQLKVIEFASVLRYFT